jgi:hypothetical protein
MKNILYFKVTVLLLVIVFWVMTGCMKEETGIKSSSQLQNEIKQEPVSEQPQDKIKQEPASPEPQKNVGIKPFGY